MFLFTSATLKLPSFLVVSDFLHDMTKWFIIVFLYQCMKWYLYGNQSFLSKIFHSAFCYINHINFTFCNITCRATPELIFTNFFIDMYPKWIFVFLFNTSVSCDTFSSDILIRFDLIDLYSVVDSSNPINLLDLESSRKQFFRNMVL